jgi:hypothetical protein
MNASIGVAPMHCRQIEISFGRRGDGLYEIEGWLLDTTSHSFRRQLATEDSPPGTALHRIGVRLVVDDELLIHHASANLLTTPFETCHGAEQTLAPLEGIRIESGWMKRVKGLLGGAASCTHVVELLGPMATTAFQGLAPIRMARLNAAGDGMERRKKVDSCYAYAAHRDVVARLWPHLHKPETPPTEPV